MAFGAFNDNGSGQPMAEINMIPLIDVMLVLLIIFIVTAPLLTHSIRIDLPQASARTNVEEPETVRLSIDERGGLFWNEQAIDAGELGRRMKAAALRDPQPELHLLAEKATPYQTLAEVMAEAQNAGLLKIGFITQPDVR